MKWIWQQPDWPDFRYDNRALNDRELEFRLNSERLAGSFDALPMASQEDATIDLMLSEAIKTSAIEGEDLDRESVRSSLLSLITSDTLPDNSEQKAAGAASLLVDVRKNWQTSLTHDLLGLIKRATELQATKSAPPKRPPAVPTAPKKPEPPPKGTPKPEVEPGSPLATAIAIRRTIGPFGLAFAHPAPTIAGGLNPSSRPSRPPSTRS